MRWGVRDDASDDHTTTALCMEEIDNCRRLSIGTYFLVSPSLTPFIVILLINVHLVLLCVGDVVPALWLPSGSGDDRRNGVRSDARGRKWQQRRLVARRGLVQKRFERTSACLRHAKNQLEASWISFICMWQYFAVKAFLKLFP